MSLLDKIKHAWKQEFACEVPEHLLDRVEFHKCADGPGAEINLNHIQALSGALDHTRDVINGLRMKLQQEQFMLTFLTNEIESSNDTPAVKQTARSKTEDHNGETEPVGCLYAQVNKSSQHESADHLKSHVTEGEPSSVNASEIGPVYEEVAVELAGDSRSGSIKVNPVSCAPTRRSTRGSVTAKVKMFEKNDSSSDESTDGEDNHTTRPLPPKRPSMSARRRQKVNAYEEIVLSNTGDTTSSPEDKGCVETTASPGYTGVNRPLSPTPNTDGTNNNLQCSLSNKKSEFISQTKSDLFRPPVPQRTTSQGRPVRLPPKVMKKPEPTLAQSDKEPSFSSSVTANSDIKVSVRNKFRPIAISPVEDDENEGDYCSLKDIQKHKHVTLVQVKSGGSEKSDNDTESELSKSKSVTVLDVKKPTSLVSETDNLCHDKVDQLPSPDTGDEIDSIMNEKKILDSKSSDSYTELDLTCDHRDGAVTGKGYKSLSSSESEEDSFQKGIPIIMYDQVANNPKSTIKHSTVRKLNRKRVPDYESFNFDTLLTKKGISAAEMENFTDTGSEDETPSFDNTPDESLGVDITANAETPSGQSDDSGMYDSLIIDTSIKPGGFGLETMQIDPDELRKISTASTISCDSRLSSLSYLVVDPSQLFVPRCDSIDSPSSPLTPRDHVDGKGQDFDNISVSSLDDQLEKADEEETLTEKREKQRNEQLRMRHMVVQCILDSEQSYLRDIEQLVKAKMFLQSISMTNQSLIAPQDVTTIFYMLDEIFQKHREFVDELEDKVACWKDDQTIGKTFKLMVLYFKMYEGYVANYPLAIERIQHYQDNEEAKQLLDEQMEPFKDKAKLEDVLLKPIVRMQRNTLLLHDLVKHTPEDHPDYIDLKKALKLSEENLKTYNSQPGQISQHNMKESRQLVKSGFVVEVSRDKKCTRHIRYMFLFSDILICTKHKASSSKHKDGTFKYVWSLPVCSGLHIQVKVEREYELKESLDDLKMKIGNLKVELRDEMLRGDTLKDKTFSIAQRKTARVIDRLKKKIQEQEATLVEALPRLPLNLDVEGQRAHRLLFASDYEREEWREAVDSLRHKHEGSGAVQLSVHDIEALIHSSKFPTHVNSIGTALLNKDEEMLNGSLNVTIHKLHGLDDLCDTYCCLELDSYGHFYKQAQTRLSHSTVDAAWDQDFEIDLDGSQTLRILVYKQQAGDADDVIIGKCALELSLSWLRSKFNEKTIAMNDVSLTISIRHTQTSKTLKRTRSRLKSGIFGVNIQNITKRENKTVPTIVTTCVQQIEKRGLSEVGIYRVSGVTSDVQHLKKLFDKNPIAANAQVECADINAVTGVLKLYFRELTEPVFTDRSYQSFIQTIELSDEEVKEQCMLGLLHALHEANYYTIVYMMEHLARVSQQSFVNKMSANNLAMIFGPTFLHPTSAETSDNPILQMAMAARDASIQCEVVHFFIKLASSGKNLRKSAMPDS